MAIFDTSVLISALAGEGWAEAAITRRFGEPFATTVINRYELLKGRGFRTKAENSTIDRLLSMAAIRKLDEAAVDRAAELFDRLKGLGKPIDEFDILIAAIAVANDETLVTADRHFDVVPGLKVDRASVE